MYTHPINHETTLAISVKISIAFEMWELLVII